MVISYIVVMNCVGPYAFLGEPVIKAVLSASESLRSSDEAPTDYIDLCGEPAWVRARIEEAGCDEAFPFDSSAMMPLPR